MNTITNWTEISKQKGLSESFMNEYKDYLDWALLTKHQIFSESFIEKHQSLLKWDQVAMYQKLSESFIEQFQNNFHWYYISKHQTLSEEFMEKHAIRIKWNTISKSQKLSESFIEKFQAKLDWFDISENQELSESFIEKHTGNVKWATICKHQTLSFSFLNKNIHCITLKWLQENPNLSLSEKEYAILNENFIQHWKAFIRFENLSSYMKEGTQEHNMFLTFKTNTFTKRKNAKIYLFNCHIGDLHYQSNKPHILYEFGDHLEDCIVFNTPQENVAFEYILNLFLKENHIIDKYLPSSNIYDALPF